MAQGDFGEVRLRRINVLVRGGVSPNTFLRIVQN